MIFIDNGRHDVPRWSRDPGQEAAGCLAHQRRGTSAREWLSRSVVRHLGGSAVGEADLLSYLLFDRCYADRLIELGRSDVHAAAAELVAFFS